MSATCAFSTGFDSGFTICVADTKMVRRVITRTRPAPRRLIFGGETWADSYTELARIILSPHVGAETYALAYTEAAASLLRTSEIAQARMLARLTGSTSDIGEFAASIVLVDEDVELLVLGVV